MAHLAIQGHATRGNKVIELLKMLGGVNKHNYTADCESLYFYISNETNNIYYDWVNCPKTNVLLFTLEDFLKRYPYRVGDRVIVTDCISPYTISDMIWEDDEMKYRINCEDDWLTADELHPYTDTNNLINTLKETQQVVREGNEKLGKVIKKLKREDMEKKIINEIILPDWCEYRDENDNVVNVKKIVVYEKPPQYPKTYEECCDVLIPDCVEFNVILNGYNGELLEKLGQLLICRDAYWKLANNWQPNWKDFSTQKYSISVDKDEIITSHIVTGSRVLVFPTAEMRDIFYENFKELINQCKELL